MKKNLIWTVLTILIVMWLSFPTQASAAGPPAWQWAARQQTVKVVGGWAYRLGNNSRMPYAKAVQELREQGYVPSGWSSVGGTNVAYFYFTQAARALVTPPVFGFMPSAVPGMFLRQVNPLHFPARGG